MTLINPNTDLEKEKNKACFIADEKSHRLLVGTQRESNAKKKNVFPTILGQGAPSFRNHFHTRKLLPPSWHVPKMKLHTDE